MKRILFIAFCLAFCLVIVGCRSTDHIQTIHDTTYVPTYVNKYETKYDSVYIDRYRDRYHTIYTKGDTIFVHDSIYIEDRGCITFIDEIHDTIYVQTIKPVEVVKQKTNWKLMGLIGLIGIVLGWKFRRRNGC